MIRLLLILFAIVLLLKACSPATNVTATWNNPNIGARTYQDVFVAAFTDNMSVKQTIESEMVAMLRQRGVNAQQSSAVFTPNFTEEDGQDRATMLEKIRQTGADAILTISLINTETENRYVPGGLQPYDPMMRFGYYGQFWGYYHHWFPRMYSPGYYREDRTYFIETNLYDGATEELIWSAQSETMNPASLQGFSHEFAGIITDRLRREGILVSDNVDQRTSADMPRN